MKRKEREDTPNTPSNKPSQEENLRPTKRSRFSYITGVITSVTNAITSIFGSSSSTNAEEEPTEKSSASSDKFLSEEEEQIDDAIKVSHKVLLDPDLLAEIMKYLDIFDLGEISQVNKFMHQVSESDWVWNKHLISLNIPLHWQVNLPSKERVKNFLNECAVIAKTYPREMVQALGAKNIARLPVIESDKIQHSVRGGSLYFSGVGRGVSTYGTHYIGLAAKTNDDKEPSIIQMGLFEIKIMVGYRSFNRYCGQFGNLPGKDFYFPNDETHTYYLERLLNKEPCGRVTGEFNPVETEPKSTADGRSIVELIDADEYEKIKPIP